MIRSAYLKRVEDRLKALVVQINMLRSRLEDEKSPEIRARYREQIALLERRVDSARASLQRVRGALEGAWGRSKAEVESSLAELKKAIDAAIEKLRKSA